MSKHYDDLVEAGIIYGVRETELEKLPTIKGGCCVMWDVPWGYPIGRCPVCGLKGNLVHDA